MPLAVERTANSSADIKTTQIANISLKCTLAASDFAAQLFLFTPCSSVKKCNSISGCKWTGAAMLHIITQCVVQPAEEKKKKKTSLPGAVFVSMVT